LAVVVEILAKALSKQHRCDKGTVNNPCTHLNGLVNGAVAVDPVASILASVHAFYCVNPVCSRPVEQTRNWHKFCSATCRQQYSIIYRAAKLLKGMTDEDALKVIRGCLP